MNKPKVLFVFDHKDEDRWQDGLWAAVELLKEDFEVKKVNLFNERGAEVYDYDFVLGWGGFHSKVDQLLQSADPKVKRGLCIAGNAFPPTGADNYDVLFYETKWYRPQISFHKNIVHAFGINSEIFNQEPPVQFSNMKLATPVVWDYLGVGSFSSWKRWEKFYDKKGIRLIVGEYQLENEQESLEIVRGCLQNGIMVSSMVHPIDLANIYKWSGTVYIPADVYGGGERAIMEAKSCGCRVEYEPDNPKLKEIAESSVLDEKYYAKKLKEGILSVL